MQKISWCLGLVAAAGLATAPASRAQTPAPTAAELKKSFATIAAGTEGESDAFDQLTATTARRLVKYLKAHEVSAAAAKSLGLDLLSTSNDAAHLRVFTYSYGSGGTRGTIHRSVFQWKNPAGKLFAYSFGEEGGYGEMYELASPGRTQYLLLGSERGSGICMRGIACLLELKGDYLLLDDKAFDNKPLLDICNIDLTYQSSSQTLAVAAARNLDAPDVYSDKPFRPFKLYFVQGRFIRKK